MTNREKLRKWLIDTMERHHLSDADVAQLVHGSVHRVRAWRRMPDAKGGNPIPLGVVELMAVKLAIADMPGPGAADMVIILRRHMPNGLRFQQIGARVELGKREDT